MYNITSPACAGKAFIALRQRKAETSYLFELAVIICRYGDITLCQPIRQGGCRFGIRQLYSFRIIPCRYVNRFHFRFSAARSDIRCLPRWRRASRQQSATIAKQNDQQRFRRRRYSSFLHITFPSSSVDTSFKPLHKVFSILSFLLHRPFAGRHFPVFHRERLRRRKTPYPQTAPFQNSLPNPVFL